MPVKNSLLKDISSVFSTKIVVLLLSVVGVILLARALGPEGRGILAAALIYPQLLISITEGGMRQAATFFIGQKKATDAEVLGSLFSYVLLAGAFGYVVVYSLMLIFGQEQFDTAIVIVACSILPTTLAVNAFQGYFLGKQQIKSFNKVLWVQKVLYVAALLVLYLTDLLSVFTAILLTALVALYNAIQTFLYVRAVFNEKLRLDFTITLSMLKVGLVFAIALFLIQANYKIDILLLSWLSDSVELGNYAVAVQLGELLWQLPAAVLVVLMSRSANSSGDELVPVVCRTARLTLFITFVLSVVMISSSYFLIEPVFGENYSGVFKMLLFLSPGLIVATLFKTINAFYAGSGRPKYAILVMGVAVLFNVVGNYLLIPALGGVGAAISSTLSYFVSAVIMVVIFSKKESVGIRDIIFLSRGDCLLVLNKLKKNVR